MVRRRVGIALLVALAASLASVRPAAAASPTPPRWAPAAQAYVHPGVQVFTQGSQCTANFVFYDFRNVYLGQAAHCSSQGTNLDTNGCTTPVYPLGTRVEVGGQEIGSIVYNSWIAMRRAHETSDAACSGNDLALIRVDPYFKKKVNPSIPFWGGPTGLQDGVAAPSKVYSFGNSLLRLGLTALSPKTGYKVFSTNGFWTHEVYTATPGIPGDSGSAFLGSNGKALGVLSTLSVLGSNGVCDLRAALDYMYAKTTLDSVRVANGTTKFSPLL